LTLSDTRTRVLAVILLLLCVGGGFAGGMIVDRVCLVRQGRLLPSGGLEFLTRHLARQLDRSLALTDQQENQIEQILERHRLRILADWRDTHSRFHQEILQANHEISAVLTPEQRVKFDELHRKWVRRHQL
jgi:Spy/CpxP family protein refolding chaperone